jgi:dihydrolipoamide dehydrogenase
METLRTEVVVVGAGPGGYVAAIRLGQMGKKVVCVDREYVGGVCLNVGCIPSKALISASKAYERARHNETMGITASDVKIDMTRLQAWKGEVVGKLTGGVRQLLKAAGAQLIMGEARFTAPPAAHGGGAHRLEVRGRGEPISVEADHIVVATGSRAIEIPGFAVDHKRVLDSTSALALDAVPRRLLVIGGGYIGLEIGTLLSKLGSQVTVVEATAQLLPGVDPELVQVVARKLKKAGVEIHLTSKALGYEEAGGALRVRLETPSGPQSVEVDRVLVTVGRRPNSDGLGLENVGVAVDKGFIRIDKQQRTTVAGVYAIGDVAGGPMLAHKASREAEVVAEVIAGQKTEMDAVAIPAVIFTDPEIATVGLQAHEAEAKGRKVKVGKFPFGALGRALAIAETDGFVKVIADAATDELLGLSVVGPEASDLISEGALALEMGAFLPDLALTVHPHPTLGEAVMEAAKAALGESPHLVGGGARR